MTLDLASAGICLALVGLAVALFFGIRSIGSSVTGHLTRIEEHTKHIEKIEEIAIRLDERIKTGGLVAGTVEGTLKNLGKVTVKAVPGPVSTKYYITVEKSVLDADALTKIEKQTEFPEKEKLLFGRECKGTVIDPRHALLEVPSIDPKVCTEFVSLYLSWLDSTYYPMVRKQTDEYENITFPS